jgi:exonuclease SbcD
MLRFIHTSDWHLGHELYGHQRLEEQNKFLNWLIEISIQEKIHALLISGDVFDVNNPSIAAQTLFTGFIAKFKSALPSVQIIIIAGNHDSGLRMEIFRPLTEVLGQVHVVGYLNQHEKDWQEKHLIKILNSQQEQIAWCVPIPFLRPSDLICQPEKDEAADVAFRRTLAGTYRSLVDYAEKQNNQIPIIGMGHLTVLNTEKVGSERLLIGGLDSISAEDIISGLDYLALGHLHKRQSVKVTVKDELDGRRIQYCGSPLSISFDERRYQHQILMVSLTKKGTAPEVKEILIPQWVDFLRFSEPLKPWPEVKSEMENYDWENYRQKGEGFYPFVEIQFELKDTLYNMRELTEELAKKYPIRLVANPKAISEIAEKSLDSKEKTFACLDLKDDKAPLKIFEEYYFTRLNQTLPDELKNKFLESLNEAKLEIKNENS